MSELRGDRIRKLGDQARELTKLKEQPGWATLREILEERRQAVSRSLGHGLVTGGIDAAPVDQRKIDYQRGFFAGAQWILDNPEHAEKILAAALEEDSS